MYAPHDSYSSLRLTLVAHHTGITRNTRAQMEEDSIPTTTFIEFGIHPSNFAHWEIGWAFFTQPWMLPVRPPIQTLTSSFPLLSSTLIEIGLPGECDSAVNRAGRWEMWVKLTRSQKPSLEHRSVHHESWDLINRETAERDRYSTLDLIWHLTRDITFAVTSLGPHEVARDPKVTKTWGMCVRLSEFIPPSHLFPSAQNSDLTLKKNPS